MAATRKHSSILASVAAAALLTAGLAGEAVAQQQQPAEQPPVQPPAEQQTMPPAEVNEEQLEAFADAALDVQRVQQEFSAELQQVDDPERIEELQMQAHEQAAQAVEDKGLTIEEYNTILQAANADPELYSTIVAMMESKTQ